MLSDNDVQLSGFGTVLGTRLVLGGYWPKALKVPTAVQALAAHKYVSVVSVIFPVAELAIGLTLVVQVDSSGIRHLDPTTKEVNYNPKFEELYAPQVSIVFILIMIDLFFLLPLDFGFSLKKICGILRLIRNCNEEKL